MIETVLEEREKRYGSFEAHALISQNIKEMMYQNGKFAHMSTDQQEALEMIAHKIARILNGDPDYADNWVDIAGYATLVAKRLEKKDA